MVQGGARAPSRRSAYPAPLLPSKSAAWASSASSVVNGNESSTSHMGLLHLRIQ